MMTTVTSVARAWTCWASASPRNLSAPRNRTGMVSLVWDQCSKCGAWVVKPADDQRYRLLGKRGAAGPFAAGDVADVAEVFDADFAGVEAVASEVAHGGKEGYALAQLGSFLGVFSEGDEVQRFFALLGS